MTDMPGRRSILFKVAGKVFSTLVLGYCILFGSSSPLLFLWGLWIEEVLVLIGLSEKTAIARRRGSEAGGGTLRLAPYFAFPAVHFVFVLVYSVAGVAGIFSAQGSPLLAFPRATAILELAAALVFWHLVDLARVLLRSRTERPAKDEAAGIDRDARLALFLPHVTIIAGGFCLILLRLGNWLAWGILAGKVIFELLSLLTSRPGAPARAPHPGSR